MAEELEYLQRDIALKHAAVVAAREVLIEALGDRMCGCKKGPAPEDIKTFELARQAEAEAKEQLGRYLVACSQEVIDQARRAAERPGANLDQQPADLRSSAWQLGDQGAFVAERPLTGRPSKAPSTIGTDSRRSRPTAS